MKPCTTLHLVTLTLVATNSVGAEVTLDGSLGRAGALPGPNYQISADLGQQHGGNLFHSFRDFNLQSHESATFSGPTNLQNVISRVTGGNPSSIDGMLRSTIPNANLYFLNPFGIMFGPNAKLDVQGSFHASTADYLRLQDGGQFQARVPSNSLLTVAPPEAFGFLTNTPAAISIQDSHLSVTEGKTLSLIGGDLRLTGTKPYTNDGKLLNFDAELTAPGGRINLASVASQGEVMPTDTELSLSQVARRGAILAQNALIDASGSRGSSVRGGSVFIRGGQVELTGSGVASQTNSDQNGGSIDVQVDNLKLWQGSQISSGTYGTGNAGSVVIKADTVEAAGRHESGNSSSINSESGKENSGNAGTVEIIARQITLTDGAIIGSNTPGTGQGGAITLKVADNLTLTGSYIAADSYGTMPQAGNAGNITIQARQVNLTNGAQINSLTRGSGQGGSIHLQVSETLTATGQDAQGNFSGISANSENEELEKAGQAGNIEIEAGQIVLTNGGQLDSSTSGTGQGGSLTLKVAGALTLAGTAQSGNSGGIYANSQSPKLQAGTAGNITIQARQVNLSDGTQINSFTSGGGQGGTLHLQVAETLTATGQDAQGNHNSGISATSNNQKLEKAGNAGNIEIEARQIVLTNGGRLNSSTFGTGQGGSIILKGVDTLTVSGSLANVTFSQIIANSGNTEIPKAGDAGNVEIEVRQINLTENGQIGSVTRGSGQGGKVVIRGVDTLIATGEQSGISSTSLGSKENSGNAGDVRIEARQVTLTNGGRIASETNGAGQGGTIHLQVSDTLTTTGQDAQGNFSGISASSNNQELEKVGNAGNLEIEARQIVLTKGGKLESKTSGTGQGGSIILKVAGDLTLTGSSISATSEHPELAKAGQAGDITLAARQITLTAGGQINSSTSGTGQGGSINIQAESLTIDDKDSLGSSIAANSESQVANAGNAGQLQITTRQLTLTNGAQISSGTFGSGQGGSIILKGIDILNTTNGFINASSGNRELANAGDAGNINIEARQINLTANGLIASVTLGTGKGGKVVLHGVDTLVVNESGITSLSGSSQEKSGDAGEVRIEARQITLTNGGGINTTTNNAGGGNITLTTPNLLYLRNGQITTSVKGGTGNGGNITINNPVFVVLNQGQIKAQADQGRGGNIDITSRQFLQTPQSIVSASSRKGINGTVVIRAPNETVSNSLNLPPDLLDVTNRLPKLCHELSEEEYDNRSHFFVHRRAITGPSPSDLQGSSVWFLLPYFRTTPPPPGKVPPPARHGQVQAAAKPWLVMMECQKMKKTVEKKSAGKAKNLKVKQSAQ